MTVRIRILGSIATFLSSWEVRPWNIHAVRSWQSIWQRGELGSRLYRMLLLFGYFLFLFFFVSLSQSPQILAKSLSTLGRKLSLWLSCNTPWISNDFLVRVYILPKGLNKNGPWRWEKILFGFFFLSFFERIPLFPYEIDQRPASAIYFSYGWDLFPLFDSTLYKPEEENGSDAWSGSIFSSHNTKELLHDTD